MLQLLAQPNSNQAYNLLTDDITANSPAEGASILLINSSIGDFQLLAGNIPALADLRWPLNGTQVNHLNHGPLQLFAIGQHTSKQPQIGYLVIQGTCQNHWQSYFEALAIRLAELLQHVQQGSNQQRVVLYEERSLVARELHDSLAQSLSYLNIQVSRLQSALKTKADADTDPEFALFNTITQNIRTTVTDSNHQLREIITSFRLTMRGRSFNQALEDSVDDFAKRSTVVFELDNRLLEKHLATHEEVQFLQIAREAFSNIVRHSHAKHAWITCLLRDDQAACLTIDDDGIRNTQAQTQTHTTHHGLIIMQERAHKMNARFQVGNSPQGGTRVQLVLPSKGPQTTDKKVTNAHNTCCYD